MTYPCSHCREDLGELTENAAGLAGELTVRVLTVHDGAVRAKCRRCSHWTDLPLRVTQHPAEVARRRGARVGVPRSARPGQRGRRSSGLRFSRKPSER